MKKYLFIPLILFCVIAKLTAQSLNEKWELQISNAKQKYKNENYDVALQEFIKASKLIPTDSTAFVYILDCAYRTKNTKWVYKSFDNLKFLKALTPNHYHIIISTARLIENDYQKAINFVASALKKYPDNVTILFDEIHTYLDYGDWEKAEQKTKLLLKKYPKSFEGHKLLLYIQKEKHQDFGKSLQTIKNANQYFTDSLNFHKQEADIYIRTKQFDKAQAKIENLIEKWPNNDTLYYNLALLYFEKQDYKKSAEICKKAIEINPNYLEAIYNVGTFYVHMGLTYNSALSDMTVQQYKSQGLDFEEKAIYYLSEAKPYYEKAIELNPDELDAYENLNTINVLLENLKANQYFQTRVIKDSSMHAMNKDSLIEQKDTTKESDDLQKPEGQPVLLISNLQINYPQEENRLFRGDTAQVMFKLQNFGTRMATGLKVHIMEPIAIPGLHYKQVLHVDTLRTDSSMLMNIPIYYRPNDVDTKGIKKIDGAQNKLRIFVKEPMGYNTDLLEVNVHIANDRHAGDKKILVADYEILKDFKPEPIPNNYLFIMAVDKYKDWPHLSNALKDARDVKQTLIQKYNFDDDYVYELYNEDVTKENIRNELIKIKNELRPIDNLLIYYAGHGFYDKEFDDGYWVPVDARMQFETDYLSNLRLLKYLQKLSSRHTLLVADACFSGSLFVEEQNMSFQPNNDSIPSRWGLSSGNMETVADGAPGENSPFAKSFIQCLNENKREGLPVSELIYYVKFHVKNSTEQTPIGRPLKMKENKGGEFILYKK